MVNLDNMASMDTHQKKVTALIAQFASLNGEPLHLKRSGKRNTMRTNQYKKKGIGLDISHFSEILKIDVKQKIAIVEPRVTMDQLASETLKVGLIPKVVPEFKGITVGGAIQGTALESSSHQFGQFSDICKSYEVLTGNGEILQVSPNAHSDLFYGLSGSFGSVGIILSAEVELIEAPRAVNLKCIRFHSVEEALKKIEELRGKALFLEGVVYGPEDIVIIQGDALDQPVPSTISLSRPWSEWYYIQLSRRKEKQWNEVMTPYDWLFRYDLGAFWMASYFMHRKICGRFWIEKFFKLSKKSKPKSASRKPPGRLFRLLFGWFMTSERLYRLYHAKGENWFAENFVIQDFYIPVPNVQKFIQEVLQKTKITPLFLCPMKKTMTPQFFSPHAHTDHDFTNVGVYGYPAGGESGKQMTRWLEELAKKLGGRKMLYAHTYYSPEEFWQIYPKESYDDLRKKYFAEGTFRSITEKILSPLV